MYTNSGLSILTYMEIYHSQMLCQMIKNFFFMLNSILNRIGPVVSEKTFAKHQRHWLSCAEKKVSCRSQCQKDPRQK